MRDRAACSIHSQVIAAFTARPTRPSAPVLPPPSMVLTDVLLLPNIAVSTWCAWTTWGSLGGQKPMLPRWVTACCSTLTAISLKWPQCSTWFVCALLQVKEHVEALCAFGKDLHTAVEAAPPHIIGRTGRTASHGDEANTAHRLWSNTNRHQAWWAYVSRDDVQGWFKAYVEAM